MLLLEYQFYLSFPRTSSDFIIFFYFLLLSILLIFTLFPLHFICSSFSSLLREKFCLVIRNLSYFLMQAFSFIDNPLSTNLVLYHTFLCFCLFGVCLLVFVLVVVVIPRDNLISSNPRCIEPLIFQVACWHDGGSIGAGTFLSRY